MRLLLILLLVLLAAIGLGIALHYDNGYVVLAWGAWTVEMSLVLLGLFLIAGLALLWLVSRLLFGLLRFPASLRHRLGERRHRRAREALTQGLVDLAEGRWQAAERRLTRRAEDSETPLINYLIAARAAQLQGAHRRRDIYLKNAYEQTPSATVAVLLTQAELQLAHRQYEHALATLRRLQELSPGHRYGLRLLARAYQALGDWPSLEGILPQLRRSQVFSREHFEQLERECCLNLIERHARMGKRKELDQLLGRLPRRLRRDREIVHGRIIARLKLGQATEAEADIEQSLRQEWDPDLVIHYGLIEGGDVARRLTRAEQWLGQHPASAGLLLTTARLCIRNQLWGKARQYLEQSLSVQPRPDAYEELGRLLDHLGEEAGAAQAYRRGLELAIQRKDTVPEGEVKPPVIPLPDSRAAAS